MEIGVYSLLPALLAVVLAFWSRNVLLSLGLAVLVGTTTVAIFEGAGFMAPLQGVGGALTFVWEAVSSFDNLRVTAFSLLVGGCVGVLSASGATSAMVKMLMRIAKSRESGMIATWLAGLALFFDDYANCLVVGNSMRPLADRLGISREKLAYIVDSTAAPIASVALISTWAGYEVSIMGEGLIAAGSDADAYAFFVEGVGYRYYCLFTIVFVGAIAWTGRDFGPMRRVERESILSVVKGAVKGAEESGESEEESREGVLFGALSAILPMVLLVFWTLGRLLWDGSRAIAEQVAAGEIEAGSAGLIDILGSADSYGAMLEASIISILFASILALVRRTLDLKGIAVATFGGMKQISGAVGVLILAWTLGSTMGALGTSDYLVGVLEGVLSPALLPTVVFVVSALTAFATGTSFGTMGLMVPIVIPLSFSLTGDPVIHLAASGAVLSGACWGDHCSPISDTTVLSSIGAGCDHIKHVETQLPYAMVCGAISIVAGSLPVGFGVSVWWTLIVGSIACVAAVMLLGTPPPTRAPGAEASPSPAP